MQSPVRYDSFESLSLSIPLLQWVSKCILKWYCRITNRCNFLWLGLLCFHLSLSPGSTYFSGSVSSAFYFLRNHKRSGVWKLHSGIITVTRHVFSNFGNTFMYCRRNINKDRKGRSIWFHSYDFDSSFWVLSSQLQQRTTMNGQVLENQRTTFVKQLKLGKVPYIDHII